MSDDFKKYRFAAFALLICIYLGIADVQAQSLPAGTDTLRYAFQPEDSVWYSVEQVDVMGYKRTRHTILIRELDLKVGTQLQGYQLKKQSELDRNKLFNTLLFVSVNSYFEQIDSTRLGIHFKVAERWYTFPIPILEVADRNINEWWTDRNRDLRRIDYGLAFNQFNFTGRHDDLKLVAQGGFTQKFEAFYRLPYIDRKQKNGITLGASYSTNKNVAYTTEDNKLKFTGLSEEVLRSRFYAGLQYVHRQRYYSFFRTDFRFNRNEVADTIVQLNRDYLPNGMRNTSFFSLAIQYTYDKRDIAPYPLKGYFFQTRVDGLGLGLSSTVEQYAFLAEYARYWSLSPRWYAAARVEGKASTPRRQAYMLQRGLGYGGDLVRGFERNVIDGQQTALIRTALRYKVWSNVVRWGNAMPLEQFRAMPVAIYMKGFYDSGYVYDAFPVSGNQRFSNRPIHGTGIGIDFVTYYDLVFRIECAINSFGIGGVFFNFMADI